MFFLWLAVAFVVSGLLSFWRFKLLEKREYYDRNYEEPTWETSGIIFFVVAAFLVVLGLFISLISNSNQRGDFEDLHMLKETQVIYQEKAEALTQQFAKYLAEQYPDQERFIFDKIDPDKVALYLVKYPEIKSSETLMALVVEIGKLQAQVYDQRIKRAQIKRDIRFRLVNPWRLNFLISEPPAELMGD
ncbi:hypothetical protein GYA54_04490 [Candidatus Kuenenbacteria bacterium]|nr:hypothetical protein [Candidatus Kuenenbacteria bacterium]